MTDSTFAQPAQRMIIGAVSPAAYQAVRGMENFVRANVDADLRHLIKLRASMLNGCAFCVDMHSQEGIADKMDTRKLFAVSVWREAPFFDERERIALELTDQVTRLDEHGVTDEVWAAAVREFGEEGVANLLMTIATINVWNRLSVATRNLPPTP